MSIPPGSRIGPYEIVAALGAGGMGEVYRARDTRLGREVALKVLPASMAVDDERLRRFTLEAQAAGALSHPNILTIHDVGTDVSAGSDRAVPYIAAELLEGETLRAKIEAGTIPVSKAIAWARQTATGLAAAHARGITHRDVKPENLFITTDGRLKILDFGLAKATDAPGPRPPDAGGTAHPGGAESSRPETETMLDAGRHATSAGMVLGTAGYMSPEQVRAQPVDARSDIFSLGVVLYEMLAGRRPFTGDSAVETMNAILSADPPEITPASGSDRALPPAVQHVVSHCLEKNPEERFQSARDLAFALEALSASAGTASGIAGPTPPPADARGTARANAPGTARAAARGRLLPVLTVALAVLAALLGAALILDRDAGTDLSRYAFRALATDPAIEGQPAWSPDGTAVAYIREVDGTTQLFLREPDVDEPVQLTRSAESVDQPFWWPDSGRLGVLVRARLMTVGRAGGEPVPWFEDDGDMGAIQTAAISPDGATLAFWAVDDASRSTTLFVSSPAASMPRRYEPAPFEQACCTNPNSLRFAPDGRSLLFSHFGLYGDAGRVVVWVIPMPGGGGAAPREVFAGAGLTSVPEWSWLPDGRHLIAGLQTPDAPAAGLWMADVERETLTPLTVGLDGQSAPSVSPDGSRVAFVAGGPDFDLVEIPLDASRPIRDLLATSRNEYSGAWMRDARRFVYVTDRNGVREVRVRSEADGADRSIVTVGQFAVATTTHPIGAPMASPDGRRIAYHVIGTGGAVATWLSPMTGGTPTRLLDGNVLHGSPTWAPDGARLALWQLDGTISVIDVGRSGGTPRTVVEGADSTPLPAWSPDGQWIAYSRDGLHIVSPESGEGRQLTGMAEVGLAWSPDSTTLYTFDDVARALIAVDIASGNTRTVRTFGRDFTFGVPNSPSQRFSVAPDGQSLMATRVEMNADIWILEGFDGG